jgi:putative MATE family efflux protein
MKKTGVGADLTEGSVSKLLLTFALPIVLTNLIQQLYGVIDVMIIGLYVGPVGTVGVSTGGEMSDLMTPVANAFSLAGQIYIAQLVGAKQEGKIREASGTLITVMMLMSVVCMIGTLVFCNPILGLLNCPDDAFSQAAAYMNITAAGMPFIFGYNAVSGILRGMGESKGPLLFVTLSAVANVIFALLFVVVIPLEAAGTAIATAISQFVAFLATAIFMYRKREQLGFNFNLKFFKIHKTSLKVIMILGIPQLIRSFAVNFSMLWVKANLNSYGLMVSATYSVGNKIDKFMSVFQQGINGAAGAMIGQNLGAKKPERVKRILFVTLGYTMVFGVVIAIVFLAAPKEIFRLFTADEDVIEYGVVFMRIMSVGAVTVALSGPFKAMATGAGAAMLCFIIGILDGVSRVAVCILFEQIFHLGATSYFWGAALCWLLPGLICFVYFASGKWKTKKLLTEI